MKGVRQATWLFGFLAFLGLRYLHTHDSGDLVWLMFLGFFAFFFTRKVNAQMPDEMYVANMRQASQAVLWIPLISLFVIAYGIGQFGLTATQAMVIAIIGWIVSLCVYAMKLRQLEQG